MTTLKLALLLYPISVALALGGCATASKTKRYKSISNKPIVASVSLNANIFTTKVSSKPKATKTLADLPERAQKAIIEAANSSGTPLKASETGALMATKISTKKTQVNRDWTKVSRKLAVAIDYDSGVDPADRIDRLKAKFTLVDPISGTAISPGNCDTQACFQGWSRLENQRRKIDLAELVFSQSNEISGKAGLTTLTPDLDVLDVNANITRGLTETLKLKEDQLSIYGGLTDNEVFYVERGAALTDLGGMTFIDVSFSMPIENISPFGIESISKENGKFNLDGGLYKIPNIAYCSKDVKFDAEITSVIRHVVSGGNTFLEGDDSIQFIKGPVITKKGIKLASPVEINNRSTFGLFTRTGNTGKYVVVRERTSALTADPSFFLSKKTARQLLDWLNDQSSHKGSTLTQPLIFADYEIVVVDNTGPNPVEHQGAALIRDIADINNAGIRLLPYRCS